MEKRLILVDKDNGILGYGDKMQIHLSGQMHRAFSVYIFNDRKQLLIQKRSCVKYHSGGLWSNTCCSHPGPGDFIDEAAHVRLIEEMGFDCPIEEVFSYSYSASLSNGLKENEYVHVYSGVFNGDPVPNPMEVEGWEWSDMVSLILSMKRDPEKYTFWFRKSLERMIAYLYMFNITL